MASAARSIAEAEALSQQLPLPLGVSLPPGDAHALSVSIPTWEDNVGYEEARPAMIDAMACGYPRFFRHPIVRKLEAHLKQSFAPFQQLPARETGAWDLMALPTQQTAERLVTFLSTQEDAAPADQQSVAAHSVAKGLVWVVVFADALTRTANRFWQHTGETISSRHAQRVLELLTTSESGAPPQGEAPSLRGTPAHEALRKRIAGLYFGADRADETAHNVFTYPTGMGAIFAALRLLTHFNRDAKAILFGFPYLDTLKMLQRTQWCPAGVHFFPVAGEEQLQQVEELLKTEKILAIFTEFPGNPLLSTPDLERLAALAHAHGTYLAVDDTVGSYNVNPMKYGAADLVLTSLAKIFSGTCNVMAGSLVLNPQSDAYAKFHERLTSTNDAFLVDCDTRVLCEASADLEERLARVNASASLLVQRLQKHALVKSLYYPQLNHDVEKFHRFSSPDQNQAAHYGPLLSLVLHGGASVARAFFDHVKLAKGPSLGTNFTLACPYTILAHYFELDYVESCGVDRHLVRISIGLEDPETIWHALHDALGHAEAAFQQL